MQKIFLIFFGSFRHAPPAQINGKDHYFQVLIELNTLKQSTLSLKRRVNN